MKPVRHPFYPFFRFCWETSLADVQRLVVLLGGGAILGLAFPLLAEGLFDWAVPQAQSGLLWQMGGALAGAAVVRGGLEFVARRARLRLAVRTEERAGAEVWPRLLALPPQVLRASRAEALGAGAQASVGGMRKSAILLETGCFALALILVNLVFLAVRDIGFALLGLGLAVLAGVMAAGFHRRRIRALREEFILQGRTIGQVHEWIRGLAKIRLAGGEADIFRVGRGIFLRLAAAESRAGGTAAFSRAVVAGFPAAACAALLGFTFPMHLSVGEFLGLFAAFGAMMVGVRELVDVWPLVAEITARARQVRTVWESVPESEGRTAGAGLLSGCCEMRDVAFRYAENLPWVLKGCSFRVEPGEFVALAGVSGAGKSTILRLLLGFEQVGHGRLFWDGRDFDSLDPGWLRAQAGVVWQQPVLFAGDLLQNLSGEGGLSLSEAWQAAELAGIAGEIRALPMQMRTVVSEGGTNFSLGQRQRIALARMLARNPRVAVLDEALNALDSRALGGILRTLQALPGTRIVAAHRVEILAAADRVVVLQEGAVVESGPAGELWTRRGEFFRLVRSQVEGTGGSFRFS